MWHKPCRTLHPWCLCIKTRCLSQYFITTYLHFVRKWRNKTVEPTSIGSWFIATWINSASLNNNNKTMHNKIVRILYVTRIVPLTRGLLLSWISNHMSCKLWNEIINSFPNTTEWISNCIPFCITNITYSFIPWSKSIDFKRNSRILQEYILFWKALYCSERYFMLTWTLCYIIVYTICMRSV